MMESADLPPVTGECTPEPAAARLPQEFEGYQIVGELSRGGQAVVYKAIHKATRTNVALKVLMPGLLISEKARRRFEQEVELVTGLHHPYIVKVRDSGIASGQYFFAMEYVRGLALDQYVRSKALTLRQTMELFAKVCNAMAHAHRRGVIHRDLKPSNILVDTRSEPHVLDFGLAKAAGGTGQGVSMLSVTGEIKGTLSYMSPEQATGRSELIDVRTDVYSIGIVMYRALTDRFPYEVTGSTASVLRSIESTEPMRLKKVMPKFDKDVEAITLKCLEKDPSKRYHSAADLEDDIQNWLNDRPLTAKCQNTIYVLGKKLSHHRRTVAVVGLLLIIVSCLALTEALRSRWSKEVVERSQGLGDHTTQLQTKFFESTPHALFLGALEQWHKSGVTMQFSLPVPSPDTEDTIKEHAALIFLRDMDESGVDETGFKKKLPENEQWFADFVIGEAYLGLNDKQKALAAYQRSRREFGSVDRSEVSGDGQYKRLVLARLAELGVNVIEAAEGSIEDEPHGNKDPK